MQFFSLKEKKMSSKDISPDCFNFLPSEVVLKIFSYFSHVELCRVIAPVCKKWWILSKDPSLWQVLHLPPRSKLTFLEIMDNKILRSGYYRLEKVFVPLLSRNNRLRYNRLMKVLVNLLSRCTLLRSLELREQVHMDSLLLVKLPHLKTLIFNFDTNDFFSKIDDSTISTLNSNLPEIETLDFGKGREFEVCLNTERYIVTLKNLKSLRVMFTCRVNIGYNPQKTTFLQKCSKLEKFYVDYIINEDIEELSTFHCKTLRELSILCLDLTDRGILSLSSCRNLTALDLKCGFDVTDEALEALATLPCLTKLGLYNFPSLTVDGISRFFSNVTLTNLTLVNLNIDDAVLEAIAERSRNLQYLVIELCSGMSERGVRAIIDNCKSLDSLRLNGHISEMTGECLLHIPSNLQNLINFYLIGCDGITPELLMDLEQKFLQMPRLKYGIKTFQGMRYTNHDGPWPMLFLDM